MTVKASLLALAPWRLLHVDIRLQLLAVNHQLVRLAHAGGQRRFGFSNALFGVSLIERASTSPLYKVGVISPDFRHAARHLRHDLNSFPPRKHHLSSI